MEQILAGSGVVILVCAVYLDGTADKTDDGNGGALVAVSQAKTGAVEGVATGGGAVEGVAIGGGVEGMATGGAVEGVTTGGGAPGGVAIGGGAVEGVATGGAVEGVADGSMTKCGDEAMDGGDGIATGAPGVATDGGVATMEGISLESIAMSAEDVVTSMAEVEATPTEPIGEVVGDESVQEVSQNAAVSVEEQMVEEEPMQVSIFGLYVHKALHVVTLYIQTAEALEPETAKTVGTFCESIKEDANAACDEVPTEQPGLAKD